VKEYTWTVVSALVEGGARPDMVQIGNEITPGLLIHVPAANPNPDQWGNIDKVTNGVNGSTANFTNVAMLLQSGVEGVRAVDPTIRAIRRAATLGRTRRCSTSIRSRCRRWTNFARRPSQ
jgi:arabinogalactan endo-1,4-beta-galactosidase